MKPSRRTGRTTECRTSFSSLHCSLVGKELLCCDPLEDVRTDGLEDPVDVPVGHDGEVVGLVGSEVEPGLARDVGQLAIGLDLVFFFSLLNEDEP